MARKFQRLAIIISILTVLFAYLYNVPNSEGVPQINRIRRISASMKIIRFIASRKFLLDIFIPSIYLGYNI
jgi:hypothetical protein